ncbi:alpha/beta hydrolase [Streptomyces sp. ME02-6991-2A]|uniref:alpha/beta hydrolase n=1 Tax=Streptomyces sp. ME02-6991-2A TaxID=3028677 RepID=UPI0029BC34A5|nr:alpha/beta hydrolase [Streptomyces sp. ME02-6991-2A]MDX3379758.1 alpha/beta hydrolase [Streptomyces sp. ME02-6991-2A]
MPRSLQAVLVLVQLLFVATLVGAISALSTASSVDAVDGHLLGLLLYASLPGVSAFVLSLYVRSGGVWVWRGLFAVQVWFVLGAVAELGGGGGAHGVARVAIPVAVAVLLARAGSRRWFRLGPGERAGRRAFSLGRIVRLRRDGGQSALEYLGLVLVVVALVGAMMATGIGQQLTAEIRAAICSLTGSSCPAPGSDVIAGPGGGSGSGDEGSGDEGAGADSGGTSSGTGGSTSGGGAAGGGGASTTSGGSVGRGSSTSPQVDAGRSGGADASDRSATPATPATPAARTTPTFLDGFLGDGLGRDLRGIADTVLRPGESGRRIVDRWERDSRGARDKWGRGDHIGAAWEWNRAVGGGGTVLGLPGSGARVDRQVREDERRYLDARIPQNATPHQRKAWWDGLTPEQRERYIELTPERIGNLDGIPVAARDAANRKHLPELIRKLEGVDTDKAREQLAGLREIDRQLRENGQPPMYLIGMGDEGNGRAIVSFGNPDASQHVSAYVPGLNTSLDEEFAKNDLGRARDTAIGAQGYDESTASIVWLGYDAPQLPDGDGVAGYFAVMGTARAEKGGLAYRDFMGGIAATNQNKDPHLTAIGHSYGSRTVGAAAAVPGGIPGVDDIILVGSPGVGVDHAVDLGVGGGHVFVGAAANDPVTKLPSKAQVVVGGVGLVVGGPGGAYLAGDLADPGDDDLWFGKDPASKAFGARRFPVADGPPLVGAGGVNLDAHSNYFSPERDAVSADSIALIVSGNADRLKMEEPK